MASKKKIEAKAEAPSEKTVFPTALYAPGMVIGYESTTELQHLEATLAAEHRPTSPTERSLVDSIIHYEWLLRRYRWLETDLWMACRRNRSPEQLEASPYGHCYNEEPNITRLHRMRLSTQRVLNDTLAELRRVKAANHDAPPADYPPEPEILAQRGRKPNPPGPSDSPEIGFVPSPDPPLPPRSSTEKARALPAHSSPNPPVPNGPARLAPISHNPKISANSPPLRVSAIRSEPQPVHQPLYPSHPISDTFKRSTLGSAVYETQNLPNHQR